MKKYIPITLVSFLALIVWLPLWMLISGSLMPIDEIKAKEWFCVCTKYF